MSAVPEQNRELSVRATFEERDRSEIDDARPVNPDELEGVEPAGYGGEAGAVEEVLAPDMDRHIDAGGLDPVDVPRHDETGRVAGFDHDPVPYLARFVAPGDQLEKLRAERS